MFAKWPKIGILVEFVGFIGLFGWVLAAKFGSLTPRSFFPVVLQALRQIPVIGSFLSLPYIRQVGRSGEAGCGAEQVGSTLTRSRRPTGLRASDRAQFRLCTATDLVQHIL